MPQTSGIVAATDQVTELKDFGMGGEGVVKRWNAELKSSEKGDKNWVKKGEKVVKRYRDERENDSDSHVKKLNILWSNTETIKPALYARTPNPQVNRRYRQKDELAREVARVLERTAQYAVDMCDFDAVMEAAVEDYQLPGRAVTRIFYKPKFSKKRVTQQPISYKENFIANLDDPGNPIPEQGDPVYPDGTKHDDEGPYMMEDVMEYEDTEPGTVFWKDFLMGRARHWRQVPWVAFKSYLSRKELTARFGSKLGEEGIKQVPLNHTPQDLDSETVEDSGDQLLKKAVVWEIWDKVEQKVLWICPDFMHSPLDVKDPHLKLKWFYPCTRPLIMSKTTSTMVPVPEFVQYQDQADELDTLTQRIDILVKGIRVAGAYDANAAGLTQLLTDSGENKLYPVKEWAKFMDHGGFERAIAWLPIDMMVNVLTVLYKARDQVKQEIYEITGIADVVRGASDPNETATAQKIKGRFASMRLTSKQNLIAEHARQIIEMMVEIQAEHFSPETLSKISGIEVTEEMIELMKNDPMRGFAVKVETDSTIQPDEQEEKQSRVEFLTASSNFLKEAQVIADQDQDMVPLLTEMLMFGVRGFKAGRDLEQTFEDYTEKVKANQEAAEKAKQEGTAPEDPVVTQMKAEAQQEADKHAAEMQRDQESHDQEMAQSRDKHEEEMRYLRSKDAMKETSNV